MRCLARLFWIGLLIILVGSSVQSASSTVNPEKAEELKAAAPLNHSVRIIRTGRVLKLDYELLGSDGKVYDLWDIKDQNKPVFSIYQDDVKVGGGTFEFG